MSALFHPYLCGRIAAEWLIDMEKVLTVSVAAYNVEKFIHQTLDSCIASEILDDLEVLVIDDGAKDNTASIAWEYEKKYPDTFRLIQKENGGYGTTVNLSIRKATGTYFKLLDGDDWFQTPGLVKLIAVLKNTDADLIFNPMYKEYPEREVLEQDTWRKYIGMELPVENIEAGVFAGMWEVTAKTRVLRENWVDLPGRTLYTDHFYLIQMIPYARKALFLDFPVYCYRLGNAEQSVSLESRKKHIDEIVKVSELVSQYYHDFCKNSPNKIYARERARFTYMEAHRALLLMPYNLHTMKRVKHFDNQLKEIDKEIYDECAKRVGKKSLIFMRNTAFWGYWLIVPKDKLRKVLKK